MQLTCLYHSTKGMITTDDEEQHDKLIATGVWFDHPTKAKNMRETYEKQIRQQSGEGRKVSKRARAQTGIGT